MIKNIICFFVSLLFLGKKTYLKRLNQKPKKAVITPTNTMTNITKLKTAITTVKLDTTSIVFDLIKTPHPIGVNKEEIKSEKRQNTNRQQRDNFSSNGCPFEQAQMNQADYRHQCENIG